MIPHSGDLIDVSNDIGVYISVKLENEEDDMWKDILEYQSIVFGGSNDIMERWVPIS